jgi:protein-disulfide isomerase
MLQRRQVVFGSLIGLAALASGAALARAADEPTPQDVFFDPDNLVLGNAKGDVTIAEYFDFQCPYCKRDFPMVRKVVKQDGNVRLVMKDWPIFGATSRYASQLSLASKALGLDAAVLETLMATKGQLSPLMIDATLAQAGLDVGALKATYAKHKEAIDAVIARDGRQADAFNFPGTPAYVVGMTFYPGVLSEAALEAAIIRAREKK